MKYCYLLLLIFFAQLVSAQARYDVASRTEFDQAHDQASHGDTIAWQSGIYSDVRMEIDKDGLVIIADTLGTVLFTGVSRVIIDADEILFSGFQYIGGFIGNLDVMRIYGSDVTLTHVNIQNYTCHKYLVVDEVSRRTTISHCNFENRLNLDDKNILSILVDNEPGYHKIQHCSFKNFEGIGNDQGIEPIRIGLSTQGHLESRTLVEYCYFTRCNGDGEIISHKSRQNVYRYNTFEDNPVSELVLRHGDEGIVYGNFFINNMGGIRVREGSQHFIYNNYFDRIDRRAIILQNDPSDPLSDIHIYHNTIVNSAEVILGGDGANPPSHVVIANNVFAQPINQLFDEDTGSETWINNISFGQLGIESPVSGLQMSDPSLYVNAEGYYQPLENSPLIGASGADYPLVPLYPEMNYDHEILLDVMQQPRPPALDEKSIGASEYSSTISVSPHATEANTGPSYLFDNLVDYLTSNTTQLYVGGEGATRQVSLSSNIDWTVVSEVEWITLDLSSGTGDHTLNVTIDANADNTDRSGTLVISGGDQLVMVGVFQDAGTVLSVSHAIDEESILYPNPTTGRVTLSNIPESHYALLEVYQSNGSCVYLNQYPNTKDELEMNLESLQLGTYLLKIKFVNSDGKIISQLTRKLIKY